MNFLAKITEIISSLRNFQYLADVAEIDLFGYVADSRTFVLRLGCSRRSAQAADLAGSY